MKAHPENRICATCGRSFAWRKSLASNWESVRYCSDGCRKTKPGAVDLQLEQKIVALLAQRARGATICPSEAAQAVLGDDWRESMERARQAARRLVARGEVEICQNGRVVDPDTARGPIRIRRADKGT